MVDRLRRPPSGVVILAYHRVGGGSTSAVDLDTALFDDQMAELADSDRVMPLDEAVDLLAHPPLDGGTPEADPVVVTFDDGTPDVVENALPILERHRIPITLYLATSFVEDGLPFWSPDDPVLTWAALAEATSTGLVEVGSHTHKHVLLDRADHDTVIEELERSIDLIGTRLDTTADHFAYPKALAPNSAADLAVRARFDSAALAGTRANPYHDTDVHRLHRSPIQQGDGMRWFRHKLDGGMGFEDRVRERVNARRYATATS